MTSNSASFDAAERASSANQPTSQPANQPTRRTKWATPAPGHRLTEIRDNLTARITEAEREGWLDEIEGSPQAICKT
jgi:hypothetical protein